MNAITLTGSKPLQPGDRAPDSGIYRALHLRHRMPHELTVLQGEVLPRCKKCGDKVRFELIHAAPRVKGDVDLLIGICAALTAVCFAVFC